ncbi:MAG: Sll0314/Alr1548 family TPR repeat-containing protein, partial [Cyanobacteria bacterium J06553_1]
SSLHLPNAIFAIAKRPMRKSMLRLGSSLMALSLSLGAALPTVAADPFRTNSPYEIGEHTEAAFEAIFKEGNYDSARAALVLAEDSEADEPLVHALAASIAYLEGDLSEVENRAKLTTQMAESLVDSDPLRGNLYTAVGTFLEGAYILQTQGVAKGTPRALSMLQQVFSALDDAEAIDPTDPELNLIKGYMDLLLAVNLPFSNPEEAIERMTENGSPVYVAQRGIAVGYRDLEQYDDALVAVNKAIAAAPDHPELMYLKAQILRRLGNEAEAIELFDAALVYAEQLPAGLVRRIAWENCSAQGEDPPVCVEASGY